MNSSNNADLNTVSHVPAYGLVRPDTPCVAVCSTTFDEICRGCGRTVVEVAMWVAMDEDARDQVWKRILAQGYPKRRG